MRGKVEEEGHEIKEEGGAGWQWGTSCSVLLGVAVGERDMFVASSQGKKMEEQESWAREEEERTMRCKVEKEGHKIRGDGGAGWQCRTSCSVL